MPISLSEVLLRHRNRLQFESAVVFHFYQDLSIREAENE
jgi:hypothetical protein